MNRFVVGLCAAALFSAGAVSGEPFERGDVWNGELFESAGPQAEQTAFGPQPWAAAPAGGDGSGVMSADEAARKSANPLGGDFMIFLNQFDNYFMDRRINTGTTDTINSWAIQPVVPVKVPFLGEHWIWVNRPTLPVIFHADLPNIPSNLGPGGPPPLLPPPPGATPPPTSSEAGFGDIVYFSLLGVSLPTEKAGGGDLVLAAGLTQQFPTASSSRLGSGKYSLGPAAVASFIGKRFIFGALAQQWFSVADAGNTGTGVNFLWMNLFYFVNFPGGWQVGGSPVITADWNSINSRNRWTVPIALGVYNTSIIGGKMPLKLGVEFQYMPQKPKLYGQQFNVRIVVAPILPHPSKWFGS